MHSYYIAVVYLALLALTIGPVINQIRKRTLQRLSFLYAIQVALYSASFILYLDTGYLVTSNLATFLTYESLETLLINSAFGLLGFGLIVLLFIIARTRRSMRVAWLASTGKSVVPLDQALGESAVLPSLNLPTSITMRVNWRLLSIAFAWVFAILNVGIIGVFLLSHEGNWVIFAICQGFLLAFFGAIAGFISAGRERFKITPEEIRLRQYWYTKRIRWQDIRLLAIIEKDEIELSTQTQTLRIPHRKSVAQMGTGYFPTISPDEYAHIMDGLLMIARERTGLALLDLRDRPPFPF